MDSRGSYLAAHRAAVLCKGPAKHSPCTVCGRLAADWAYDHQDPAECFADGYLWSDDTRRYTAMCRSHHKRYDAEFQRNGAANLPAFLEQMRAEAIPLTADQIAARERRRNGLWATRERYLAETTAGNKPRVPQKLFGAAFETGERTHA